MKVHGVKDAFVLEVSPELGDVGLEESVKGLNVLGQERKLVFIKARKPVRLEDEHERVEASLLVKIAGYQQQSCDKVHPLAVPNIRNVVGCCVKHSEETLLRCLVPEDVELRESPWNVDAY